MKIDVLKNTIATLQKLRDVHHSQLDASALAELDDVLQQLNKLAESDKTVNSLGEITMRSLRIIDISLRLITNITDLLS